MNSTDSTIRREAAKSLIGELERHPIKHEDGQSFYLSVLTMNFSREDACVYVSANRYTEDRRLVSGLYFYRLDMGPDGKVRLKDIKCTSTSQHNSGVEGTAPLWKLATPLVNPPTFLIA